MPTEENRQDADFALFTNDKGSHKNTVRHSSTPSMHRQIATWTPSAYPYADFNWNFLVAPTPEPWLETLQDRSNNETTCLEKVPKPLQIKVA